MRINEGGEARGASPPFLQLCPPFLELCPPFA